MANLIPTLNRYAAEVRKIERALQETEKGNVIEHGFSTYAAVYYSLVSQIHEMGRTLSGRGAALQAHRNLSAQLQGLSERVARAYVSAAPSEFQDALHQNDVDKVAKILKFQDLLTKPLPNGEMPLNYAIRCKSHRVVERLLNDFSLDATARDHQKLTCIDHAFLTKDVKMIALVLGAAIGKRDISENRLAARVHEPDLVILAKEMQAFRFPPVASLHPLCQAAFLGDLNQLNALIAKGVGINVSTGSGGMTAIHYAALGGQEAILQRLLQLGAKANSATADGKTPLHMAAMNAHTGVLKRLIAVSGSNPNVRDGQGKTPLHYAVISENLDAARLLVQNGADPFVQSLQTTPFALLMHLAKKRSDVRDPLRIDRSALLNSLAYGSAMGLKVGADLLGSKPMDGLGQIMDAAPTVLNAPGIGKLGWVGPVLWISLYNMPLVKNGLHLWQIYSVGRAAMQGLIPCWKNRHLETLRPILKAGLHVFNSLSAVASLGETLGVREDFEVRSARKTFGLSPNFTEKECKKAWRTKSVKYHPDRCEQNGTCRNLSDSEKTAQFENLITKPYLDLEECTYPRLNLEICSNKSVVDCTRLVELNPKFKRHARILLGLQPGHSNRECYASFAQRSKAIVSEKPKGSTELLVKLNQSAATLNCFFSDRSDA